jgi:hypothetical protein
MAGNQLSLTNVINVSVSEAQAGAGEYNTSNLAIFSSEVYESSFGSLGYKIYLSPQEVGEDFGTDSQTYASAVSVFSQKPNILAGNGYLVVVPYQAEVQTLAFSGTPVTGDYKINFGGDVTAEIAYNATAADVQTAVRTLTGLELATVTGGPAPSSFVVNFKGYYGNAALLTITDNDLMTSAPAAVVVTVTQTTAGDTLASAITRTEDLIQYFGLIGIEIFSEADMLAAAAVVQALNKIAFFVSNESSSIAEGGMLDKLRTGNLSQSRGLYYGSPGDSDAINYMAAYAGRALSTNFSGSNTTETMHLKDLATIQPDPTMTQTLLNLAQAAGADCYVSLQGIPKVFCSGANQFFDQVYNLQWFVGALQIAGFNFLAQSSTKVPQTEQGMDGLKSAYRNICEQAITNQYGAPGTWNSSTSFGNQGDFLANISQRGYYIYSTPISRQSQAAREERQAPLVQIALKEAGAIHSSAVIVYVNA